MLDSLCWTVSLPLTSRLTNGGQLRTSARSRSATTSHPAGPLPLLGDSVPSVPEPGGSEPPCSPSSPVTGTVGVCVPLLGRVCAPAVRPVPTKLVSSTKIETSKVTASSRSHFLRTVSVRTRFRELLPGCLITLILPRFLPVGKGAACCVRQGPPIFGPRYAMYAS